MRVTVRLRLTLLYGALFVLAGAVLLTLNYAMVRRNLPSEDVVVSNAEPGGFFTGPAAAPDAAFAPSAVDGVPPGDMPMSGLIVNGEHMPIEMLRQLPGQVRARALHQLLVQSATALGLMAVASVGLGWVVAGRVLRPLHDITATARRLSEQNLDERIGLAGPPDELKELADTFDAMLGRLDAAFDGQRRFVANASHELRTPLTIMRTEIDVTLADPDAGPEQLRSMAHTVSYAVDRCERLIESLLVLARSELAVGEPQPIDLAIATRSAVAQLAGPAQSSALRVESTLDPAPMEGIAALVEQLAQNLVDNAVRHNRTGGWVHVTTGVVDGEAMLRVANSGPVLGADEVASLFEPFRRAGRDRTVSVRGAGLGLSIVRSVVAAHGGRVSARPFKDGGLEMTVLLPASPAGAGLTEPAVPPGRGVSAPTA